MCVGIEVKRRVEGRRTRPAIREEQAERRRW
jgi:hypothetical protein